MRRYILQRLGQLVLTILFLVTIQFFIFRLIPGDPLAMYLDEALPRESLAALRRQFGLDRPLTAQYILYLKNLARGDLGISFYYREPVAVVLWERLWNTVSLLGVAITLAFVTGVAIGALLAWTRGRRVEILGIIGGLLLRSLPEFWVGLLGLMIFSYWLGWFPLGGMRAVGSQVAGLWQKFISVDFFYHLMLPATCSAAVFLATPMLVMRNSMLEIIHEDFIEMAKAKGLSERHIIFRHAMRNALLPVVTVLSVMAGFAIGGEVLIETIFRWPGMGRELVLSIQRKDFPMTQAIFFLMGVVVIVANFATDLLYGYLDPRVTYD